MQLRLNGQLHDTAAPTLGELLRERGIDPDRNGIAVAVNGEVVPRLQWPERVLGDDDDVEIITATQGG